jgi:hypothetical protein
MRPRSARVCEVDFSCGVVWVHCKGGDRVVEIVKYAAVSTSSTLIEYMHVMGGRPANTDATTAIVSPSRARRAVAQQVERQASKPGRRGFETFPPCQSVPLSGHGRIGDTFVSCQVWCCPRAGRVERAGGGAPAHSAARPDGSLARASARKIGGVAAGRDTDTPHRHICQNGGQFAGATLASRIATFLAP